MFTCTYMCYVTYVSTYIVCRFTFFEVASHRVYSASEKTFRLINNTLTVVIFESNQAKLINNSRGKKTGKTSATAAAAQRCAWAWQLAMRLPPSLAYVMGNGKWKTRNE